MQGGTGDGPWDRALDDPDGFISGDATRFERWLADLRVDQAARDRARRHWMQAASDEEATLAGVLLDLAEQDAPIVVTTTSGRQHAGQVVIVGADFIGVRTGSSRHVVIALPAINAVRTPPGTRRVPGDRPVTSPLLLSDVVVALAGERAAVGLVVGVDEVAVGELRSAGTDVVVVRPSRESAAVVYVALGAISEVLLDGPVVSA